MGKLAVLKLMYLVSVIITLLLVAVTITAAFSSHFDPCEYRFLSFLGLAMPVLLMANLIMCIYWLIRFRFWLWFPLLAIAANYNYLTSVLQFSNDVTPNAKTIKVATFNIHSFNNEITGYTAKEVVNYMENEKVDIICFQELRPNMDFNIDSIYNTYQEYPYKYVPTDNGQYRISVFSKYPIISARFLPFPESSNCGLWVDVEADGKTIRVFNVHMQTTNLNRSRDILAKKQMQRVDDEGGVLNEFAESLENNTCLRAKQARYIRSLIDATKTPVILCGDFNDTPASYTYRELKGDLKDGFVTNGNGYGYTYRGIYDMLRIDYILYSPSLTGIKYYSKSIDWSDHNPVVMELQL